MLEQGAALARELPSAHNQALAYKKWLEVWAVADKRQGRLLSLVGLLVGTALCVLNVGPAYELLEFCSGTAPRKSAVASLLRLPGCRSEGTCGMAPCARRRPDEKEDRRLVTEWNLFYERYL